jgi:acyl-homoserine lactone acylase PvdQ
MFSSGLLPVRDPQVDRGLPTNGTGKYEWRGFMTQDEHPHGTEPADGVITNWNNKQAAGFQAADDNWSFGSIHREQLLNDAIKLQPQQLTLGNTVAAMNRAATQDLRTAKVMRGISAVLDGTTAPNARDQQMLDILEQWRLNGSSRLDRDLDGKIDDPGAAVMDVAWPKIADAVMSPVLGPQLNELASLMARDDPANNQGSAYISGWYGYVDKDLRQIAGRSVAGPFKTKFCGLGDPAACRDSLWAAIDAAGNELQAAQGTDPTAWRSDATAERIRFSAFMPNTMRWTNRPTFQQAISYSGHR